MCYQIQNKSSMQPESMLVMDKYIHILAGTGAASSIIGTLAGIL